MNLQLAISTMVFYHENITKLLPLLNTFGINNIEIRPNDNHFDYQDPKTIEKIKKEINDNNISVKSIHMPMNGVDISSPEEYDRVKSVREIEKVIMVALRLNAKIIVVHPGGKCNSIVERETRMKKCIDSLSEIVEFSSQWEIKIALENTIPGRLGDNWFEIQKILDKISSEYLGVCLDTGHFLLNQEENEKGILRLDKEPIDWKNKLLHIHIHDNNGKTDLHLLPEKGYFPWYQLFNYLKQIQYQGYLIVEPPEQFQIEDYLIKIQHVFKRIEEISSSLIIR
jgi:sugar phosphate isomerase/epimerase